MPVHLEMGRYVNEQMPDRLGTLYNNQEVDDEYHFLLTCNKYSVERDNCFNELHINRVDFSILDKTEQLITIMDNVHRFSNYLQTAFNKRRKIIYQ